MRESESVDQVIEIVRTRFETGKGHAAGEGCAAEQPATDTPLTRLVEEVRVPRHFICSSENHHI